jgi:hypothetical protein
MTNTFDDRFAERHLERSSRLCRVIGSAVILRRRSSSLCDVIRCAVIGFAV